MKSSFFKLSLFFLIASILGCTTTFSKSDLALTPEKEYFTDLEASTRKSQIYDGLQSVLDVSASLLTQKVGRGQLDHKARMYQWTQDQYSNELALLQSSQSKNTEIFLSFFTPERKHDNLHRPKTLWKVFLDVGGRRYEGRVEKLKGVLIETQSLYPFHNRWSSAYKIVFNLPTSGAEVGGAQLTLTGPVGATQLSF